MYNLNLKSLVLLLAVPLLVSSMPTIPKPAADTIVIDTLIRYGYLPSREVSDIPPSPAILANAIRQFQDFNGLEVTGIADEATLAKMRGPRCGFPDIVGTEIEDPSPWTKRDLTWKVLKFSKKPMSQYYQNSAIKRGLEKWSKVSGLKFTPGGDNSDLKIEFAKRYHGDDFPFDGPGDILAHAFYPEDGRVHFDDDEDWHKNSPDLETVAAHEFGHSLGLKHSKDRTALMSPYYNGGHVRDLQRDDIERIQKLYGKPY
ncbi:hypothetical protein Ahia01_001094200 [Argonauta hians]